MDVGWPPAVDVIAKGISARFDRSEKVIAMLVCQHPAAAAEIRVYRRDISVVSMAIASTRIRMPHLDERVGHRATVAIENVAMDDGLFANRFAGFGVVMDQIIIERTKLVTRKRRTGHFRQRVLQRPQWDARRAQHARLVDRRIRRRVEIAVTLLKFGVRRHVVVPMCARPKRSRGSAVALVYLDQMRQRLSYDGTHFIKQAYVGYHQRVIDHAISCPGQRRACYACRPQAVVIPFVDGNRASLTEIGCMDSIGLPGAPSRNRRDS